MSERILRTVGNGEVYVMGDNKPATPEEIDQANKLQTENFDIESKAIQSQVDKKLEKSKQIEEKILKSQILPLNGNILVKPYDENPYQKIQVSKSSGIITDLGGLGAGKFKNPDTGEEDQEINFIVVAQVLETSPDSKVIPGDDVFYTRPSQVEIPFFRQGFAIVPESRIMCVINENLKERLGYGHE